MLFLRYEWLPVMSVAPGNRQSSTSSARNGAIASALCVGVVDLLYIACQAFSALIHRKPKLNFLVCVLCLTVCFRMIIKEMLELETIVSICDCLPGALLERSVTPLYQVDVRQRVLLKTNPLPSKLFISTCVFWGFRGGIWEGREMLFFNSLAFSSSTVKPFYLTWQSCHLKIG